MDDFVKECLERLKTIQESHDFEVAHSSADNVLCDLLEHLGYKEIVDEYNKVDKYYI